MISTTMAIEQFNSPVITDHHETVTDALIRRCQQSDRVAQGEFYKKYRKEVTRIVYRVIGPDADLEDIVQDVFVEVFRSIVKFKGEAKLTTWLYRVCVNVALQKIRKSRKQPATPSLLPEMDIPSFETPLNALEKKNELRSIYRILDQMSLKKRMVFILHELLGMNAKEMAPIVGTNVLTVRTRLHYARKEFYAKLLQSDLFK